MIEMFQLQRLESGALDLSPFISVRLAQQLFRATNHTSKLYGSDVLVGRQLLLKILEHDATREGFNLTHRHDKDFIKVRFIYFISQSSVADGGLSFSFQNLVSAASVLLQPQYTSHWRSIEAMYGNGADVLLTAFQKYAANVARQQNSTYTLPFEVVTPNMGKTREKWKPKMPITFFFNTCG